MAFSNYKAFLNYVATSVDAHDPTGVGVARVLANNAQYFCDAASQQRIQWIGVGANSERKPDGTIAVDGFYRLGQVCQPILCHLHPTSGAYRFRVRLAGRSSQGDSVTFRLVITHPDNVPYGIENYSSTLGYAAEYTTTSMSAGWLSETNSKTLLTVSDEFALPALSSFPMITSTAAAEPIETVDACTLAVEVWARTSNLNSEPWISGLLVAEYIGT